MTLTPDVVAANLRVTGVLMAGLAVLNIFVPRRFKWREELALVSPLNRQIFQVHMIFLIVTLTLFAALLLTSADALVEPSRLSRAMLLGLTCFWGLRLLMQWFYYSPSHWRGHRFNTIMHVMFSGLWIYFTGVFAAALGCATSTLCTG
jgi:hypothetical protein